MRIGLVSDIHCNAAGLRAALDLMGDVDEVLCAGDAIYEFSFSNDVVATLREKGVRTVHGNHEAVFLGRGGVRAREEPTIDREHLAWLGEQPATLSTRIGGKSLQMVHGSPWDPFGEYVFSTSRKLERFAGLDTDYVIMGHTHIPMARRSGRVALINPGSTGEARDPAHRWRLTFAVLDTVADEVMHCSFPDPMRPTHLVESVPTAISRRITELGSGHVRIA
jgi:putative phosphoesterase